MTTYTVAYTTEGLILATVPDGGDVNAAIANEEEHAGVQFDRDTIRTESGLTLTDEPEDGDEIFIRSTIKTGWLMAETDDGTETYHFAVKR